MGQFLARALGYNTKRILAHDADSRLKLLSQHKMRKIIGNFCPPSDLYYYFNKKETGLLINSLLRFIYRKQNRSMWTF